MSEIKTYRFSIVLNTASRPTITVYVQATDAPRARIAVMAQYPSCLRIVAGPTETQ
jgi:hypothetical protein